MRERGGPFPCVMRGTVPEIMGGGINKESSQGPSHSIVREGRFALQKRGLVNQCKAYDFGHEYLEMYILLNEPKRITESETSIRTYTVHWYTNLLRTVHVQ